MTTILTLFLLISYLGFTLADVSEIQKHKYKRQLFKDDVHTSHSTNQENTGYDYPRPSQNQNHGFIPSNGIRNGYEPADNTRYSPNFQENHYQHGGTDSNINLPAEGNNGGYYTHGGNTQSYSQNVVNRQVPIPIPQHIPVPVHRPVPVPYPVAQPIEVLHRVPKPYPQPYPVTVTRPYRVTINHHVPVSIPQPVHVTIPRPVPVHVSRPVPVDVPRPFPVSVTRPVPIDVPRPVPVLQPVPYPVNVRPLSVIYGPSYGNSGFGSGLRFGSSQSFYNRPRVYRITHYY